MKNKFVNIRNIGLLVILVLVSGCNESRDKDTDMILKNELESEENEEVMEKDWITREYLLEQNIFTEEDLEGVDVDSMVRDYGWEKGIEQNEKWKTLFLALRGKYLYEEYDVNYEYLTDMEYYVDSMTEEAAAGIKLLALKWDEGNEQNTIIFDLGLQEAYVGKNTNLLMKGVTPTQKKALSMEDIEAVKELIDSESITEWKMWYEGTSEETTGSFSWVMYFELDDGRVIKYGGNGASGESTPENYDEFVKGLQAFFETEE